jgi:predicted GIY-YIG superfamily endonuclease
LTRLRRHLVIVDPNAHDGVRSGEREDTQHLVIEIFAVARVSGRRRTSFIVVSANQPWGSDRESPVPTEAIPRKAGNFDCPPCASKPRVHGIDKRIVYILRSDADSNRHYVGITNDIRARLEWHNHGPCGHTVGHRPWSVAVSIEFSNEQEAVHFERYLKSGPVQAAHSRSVTSVLSSPLDNRPRDIPERH